MLVAGASGGISVQRFRSAAAHAKYVPTRAEVATMPAADLETVLDFWMWESPSTLIPSSAQIAEVLVILLERPDAAELSQVIGWCREYASSP